MIILVESACEFRAEEYWIHRGWLWKISNFLHWSNIDRYGIKTQGATASISPFWFYHLNYWNPMIPWKIRILKISVLFVVFISQSQKGLFDRRILRRHFISCQLINHVCKFCNSIAICIIFFCLFNDDFKKSKIPWNLF